MMIIKAYYTCILGTAKDLPKQVEKSLPRFVPERQKVRRTFGVLGDLGGERMNVCGAAVRK